MITAASLLARRTAVTIIASSRQQQQQQLFAAAAMTQQGGAYAAAARLASSAADAPAGARQDIVAAIKADHRRLFGYLDALQASPPPAGDEAERLRHRVVHDLSVMMRW